MVKLIASKRGKSMIIVIEEQEVGIVNFSTKKGITLYKVDSIGLKNKSLKGLSATSEAEMIKAIEGGK
jgi:hypothetical protein